MIKIRIIDLLNKIANGEEVPKKIKYNGDFYTYWIGCKDYYNGADEYLFEFGFSNKGDFLNEEVEVIEDKKIEKLICGKIADDKFE